MAGNSQICTLGTQEEATLEATTGITTIIITDTIREAEAGLVVWMGIVTRGR